MIPELQSPILSAKAASAFFVCLYATAARGGKKIEDKAKAEEM